MKQNNSYTIQELEQKFAGEWVLAEVVSRDENDAPKEVKLITHSPVRDEVYDRLTEMPTGKHVATLFMGPPLPEGYAAAFYEVSD